MISYVNENLFKQDSVKKEITITDNNNVELSNEDLYLEDFELSENLCTEEDLVFGSCNASCLKFTTSYLGELKGKTLSVSVVLNEDGENPFQFGYYKVVEDKLTADRSKKEIVAYDALYDVLNSNVISWYDTILPTMTSTVTLKTFRDTFFAHFGITQEPMTLLNDTMTVQKTANGSVLSGADVLKAICSVNGCFGRMTRDGLFRYFELGTTEYEVGANGTYIKAEYEDYETEAIDKLIIRNSENDVGVTIGSGDNAYIIENNFLLWGKGTAELTPIATNIYNAISGYSYTPCKIYAKGDPCLEIGDKITVNLVTGGSIDTYILQRTYTGIQAQKDTYVARGLEEREEQVNSFDSRLIQLRGKSNELERTIEETRSTIVDVEQGLSTQITQTAEALEVEIQRLQSEIDGEIEYFERAGTPTLNNYPAWDFTHSIPFNGTIKFAPIYNDDMSEGGSRYPHFVYTEEDYQEHLRDLVFDTQNAASYRFNYETVDDVKVWGWQPIADNEITLILQQIAELRATAEELSSEYTEIDAVVTNQGRQIVTNTSNISQTATDISAEVTRATTAEGSLSSRISQNATNITAKVSKTGGDNSSFGWNLSSSAFDLYSGNTRVFRCNSSGIEVKGNATFTGTINTSAGTIGGWSITSAGISKSNGNKTIRIQSDGTLVCQQGSTILWALQNDGNVQFNGNCTINGYATASSVNALSGRIGNLEATAITANNIHSQSIYGSQITGNSITANKLNSDSFKSSRIDVATIACMNSYIIVGGRTYSQTYENGKYYLTAPYP